MQRKLIDPGPSHPKGKMFRPLKGWGDILLLGRGGGEPKPNWLSTSREDLSSPKVIPF